MISDRDYLRSLGFTVGERGRFSKEMLEALANRDKADRDELMEGMYQSIGLPTPPTPVRDAQELYGLTVGGAKVGFVMCSHCAMHMSWCECPNGVLAPDNVAVLKGAAKTIARLHPRMVQLMTVSN